MYITIKNIEALQNHLQKHGKPLKGVVVDLEKVVDQDFTQLFFDACEEYSEAGEPTLKDVTEHMKSEFDATGKDVKVFMENRVKYGRFLGKETVDFMNGEGKYSEKPYAQIVPVNVGVNKFKKHYMCPFCKNITDKPHIYNGAWFECKSCGEQLYIQ